MRLMSVIGISSELPITISAVLSQMGRLVIGGACAMLAGNGVAVGAGVGVAVIGFWLRIVVAVGVKVGSTVAAGMFKLRWLYQTRYFDRSLVKISSRLRVNQTT